MTGHKTTQRTRLPPKKDRFDMTWQCQHITHTTCGTCDAVYSDHTSAFGYVKKVKGKYDAKMYGTSSKNPKIHIIFVKEP